MATSETSGKSTGMELVVANMQNSPTSAQTPAKLAAENMRLTNNADGIAAYQPISGSSSSYQRGGTSAGGGGVVYKLPMNSGDSLKRKRGRPRMYGPDGTMVMDQAHAAAMSQPFVRASRPSRNSSSLAPPPSAAAPPPPSASVVASPPPSAAVLPPPAMPSSAKKARGWPPSKKPQDTGVWGSTGIQLMSHTFIVKEGEDVTAKIISFSENGPGTICVISANGYLSKVTLLELEQAMFGVTTTFEGQFRIQSLSGKYLVSEIGGQRRMTGGLNVIFDGGEGQLLFGCVAGCLIAASPIQVTVGISVPGVEQSVNSVPPSLGTLGESSSGLGSSLNLS